MNKLRIQSVGLPLGILFSVSYVLCVAWDLLFPAWAMSQFWQPLLPGFAWNVTGFLVGLVETIFYGYYIAVIFAPIFNLLQRRELAASDMHQQPMAHA